MSGEHTSEGIAVPAVTEFVEGVVEFLAEGGVVYAAVRVGWGGWVAGASDSVAADVFFGYEHAIADVKGRGSWDVHDVSSYRELDVID